MGVTTLNEERTIGHALRAFLDEADECCAEVLVVAAGTDRTVEIAESMLSGRPRSRLIVDNPPKGKPAALNMLLENASGNIVVLSDGDVVIRRGSVRELVDAFNEAGVGCAGGRVMGAHAGFNRIEKICDLMTEMMHLSRLKMFKSQGSIDVASGNLLAIRRELVPRLPEDINSDDGFLSLWVRRRGWRIAYVQEAVAMTNFPRTLTDFLRQKVRTRYGHLQLRSGFPRGLSRSIGSDLSEYSSMSVVRKSKKYGIAISISAIVLTGIVWFLAHARYRFPWLFRTRIWVPVASTK